MTEHVLHIKIGNVDDQNGTQTHLHKLLDQVIDNEGAVETLSILVDSLLSDQNEVDYGISSEAVSFLKQVSQDASRDYGGRINFDQKLATDYGFEFNDLLEIKQELKDNSLLEGFTTSYDRLTSNGRNLVRSF
jgi:hypothetical protein